VSSSAGLRSSGPGFPPKVTFKKVGMVKNGLWGLQVTSVKFTGNARHAS